MADEKQLLEEIEKSATTVKTHFDEELKKHEAEIRKLIDQANGQAQDGQKLAVDLKTQLDNATKKWNETLKKQQDHLDDLDIAVQEAKRGGGFKKGETFNDLLVKGMKEKIEVLKAKQSGELAVMDFNIPINKAVADMTIGTHTSVGTTTNSFINPMMVPGIFYDPIEQPRIRNLVAGGTIDSDSLRYVQYIGHEGGPTTVAEGGTKPQIDYDFTLEDAKVKKIAVWTRISEEMITDISFMSSFITNMTQQQLKLYEDEQILKGNGLGNNLTGIITAATSFAAGGLATKVENVTAIDVIRAAIHQVRLAGFSPNGIVLHPTDLALMQLTKKDASARETLVPTTISNPIPSIDGVQIVTTGKMTVGEFLVGSFRVGSQLFDKQQMNVRFYDQDRDNAITNMITIVVEERLVLANYFPNAYSYGTFAGATTALATVTE